MTGNQAENLFRREAIRSLRRRQPGRPICLMPRPWMWLNSLLILLFVASAIFLCNVEYARKEVTRGWLVSRPGAIRITHHTQATVREVMREPGESVEVGDALVYLSNDSLLPGGQSLDQSSLNQLQQDVAEIDAQLELSQQRLRIETESLAAQLQELDTEIGLIGRQIRAQRQSVSVGDDQLGRIVDAADHGAVSEWTLLQQQRDQSALRQELNAMQQKLAGLLRSRETIHGRIASLPVKTRAEKSALRLQRSNVKQQIVVMEKSRLSVLTSPISGTVTAVEALAGNNVLSGQLLMTVLPDEFQMNAELYIPSRAAGLLRPGQHVRLKYDAFPYQEFGAFTGTIEHVSEFVSLPADLPQAFPLQEVSYKVRVGIDNTRIKTDLGDAPLRPGMLLVAEIVLENRNLLDWLFEPLGLRDGLRI